MGKKRKKMDGNYVLFISWYLWIMQTFLAPKNTFRFIASTFLLMSIIIFPLEWSSETVTVKPLFFVMLFAGFGWLQTFSLHKQFHTFVLAGGLAFLFAALRLTEWYEPVIFLFGHLVTYVICFVFIHLLLFRTFSERAVSAIISSCAGEVIYQIHMFEWTASLVIGSSFFLDYVFILIFCIYGAHFILQLGRIIYPVFHHPGSNLPG